MRNRKAVHRQLSSRWLQLCDTLQPAGKTGEQKTFKQQTVPPNGIWHTSPIAQQTGLPATHALAAPTDSKKAMRDCSGCVSTGAEAATPLVA